MVLPTRDLRVNGVRSPIYEDGAPASEEAVVFVHGNPGPMEDWQDIAPALSPFSRVIALDMPGFGRADHPREFDFTIAGYARHLALVLEQLRVGRVHLVLHDFGAAWGARWAIDHPTQVASITLINPLPLCADFRWHLAARVWQTPLVGELLQLSVTPALIRYVMNRGNPKSFPEDFLRRVVRDASRNRDRAILRLYRASSDVATCLGALGAALQQLDPPACIVWGAEDRYAPVHHAPAIRQLFSRAELHTLAGLGHWPFVDDPDAVRAIVVAFVRAQLRGEQTRLGGAPC